MLPYSQKDIFEHMHIETTEKERGGGSDPRKGKEQEKGQSEKESKTKRVKGGLEKQRKSYTQEGEEQGRGKALKKRSKK